MILTILNKISLSIQSLLDTLRLKKGNRLMMAYALNLPIKDWPRKANRLPLQALYWKDLISR